MDFLRDVARTLESSLVSEVEFELRNRRHDLHASAIERGDELIVLAGSSAQSTWIGASSKNSSYQQLQQQLLDAGKIGAGENGVFQFTENVPFKSPSAAATVVQGRPANGRLDWLVKGTKQTYGDWQLSQLEASEGDADEAQVRSITRISI